MTTDLAPPPGRSAPSRRGLGLPTRITAAIVVGAMIPVAMTWLLAYPSRADQLRASAIDRLEAVANVQKARVEAFYDSAVTSARLVASRTALRRDFARLLDGDEEARASIDRIVADALAATPTLEAIALTDPDGVVMVTTNAQRLRGVARTASELDLTDARAVSSRVLTDGDGEPWLELAVPAILDGRVLGAAVVGLDLAPLAAMAGDYQGLGATGETFVAQRQEDGSAVFVTPLRFDPSAPLERSISADRTDLPITTAMAQIETSLVDAIDYRAEHVFAATRYLPGPDLGLVVKIDRDEALSGVADLRRQLLLAAVFGLALALLIAVGLTRSLMRPLDRLHRAVAAAGPGNLDERADETAPGAIGELGAAYNRMAEAVGASQRELEARIDERTEQLQRSVVELRRRNDELDAFSSVVAHDLRAPLVVLTGVVDALRDDLVDDEGERRSLLLTASRSARHLHDLIDDLLEYARAGSEALDRTPVPLDVVVGEVVDALGLDGEVTVGALPIVPGDPRSLRQVLENLIGNAAKYARDDVAPRIAVASQRVGDAWEVTVDDNGVGIEPSEREKVFVPFERGSRTRDRAGTGVGLAIVARVIERHGGDVAAAESPLGGTRIRFTLPAD